MDDLGEKLARISESSTSPEEPETRKRDDATTSGEDELRGLGVCGREKASEKDSGDEKVVGEGDLPKSMGSECAGVVDKSVRQSL